VQRGAEVIFDSRSGKFTTSQIDPDAALMRRMRKKRKGYPLDLPDLPQIRPHKSDTKYMLDPSSTHGKKVDRRPATEEEADHACKCLAIDG